MQRREIQILSDLFDVSKVSYNFSSLKSKKIIMAGIAKSGRRVFVVGVGMTKVRQKLWQLILLIHF